MMKKLAMLVVLRSEVRSEQGQLSKDMRLRTMLVTRQAACKQTVIASVRMRTRVLALLTLWDFTTSEILVSSTKCGAATRSRP